MELFRVLADVNHIMRRLLNGEPGNVFLAARRVARSLCCPKPAGKDFETLLALEAQYGFRSTFFLLHDKYWARHGARYSLQCPEIHEIVHMILEAGCELGVHGGFHRADNPALYRESLDAVEAEFEVRPSGIRNHLLRFSYPDTWCAQAQAGFAYDSTYSLAQELGPRGGWPFPFQTCDPRTGSLLDLIELPLTVMDATLFRHLRLNGESAFKAAWQAIERVVGAGGLVSLLWHNNYFNEPEYADWQEVYEMILKRLASLNPWCATGGEIAAWWKEQSL
jgi:peptidoglycan/xylan/chitin deacetylase (PgdA/CDA1 family)